MLSVQAGLLPEKSPNQTAEGLFRLLGDRGCGIPHRRSGTRSQRAHRQSLRAGSLILSREYRWSRACNEQKMSKSEAGRCPGTLL
jgi:hypothetical protein